jgi:succinoglycan biosynthesis protein ExoA
MRWVCRRKSEEPQGIAVAGEQAPFISVIVPVRNEAAFIRRTLQQLLDQKYDADRFEIIVADGQSTDSTRTIVRALATGHPNLKLVNNPRRWSSAGRNAALRVARGDVVLIVDGHCELRDSRYLQKVGEAFERSGADCLGRPQPLEVRTATALQQAIAAARSSWLGHHPASHIYSSGDRFVPPQSVAVAYRRDVFAQVGPFDENFDACEDVELNHRVDRAGLKCFFSARLRAYYHPRSTLTGLFGQMVRYGRGRVRLLRKHRDTFSLSCFVPALFLLGLILGPILSLFSAALEWIYLGVVALYAATVLLTSLTLALRERGVRLLGWLPLVFGAVHLGAGAGVLQELVAGPWRRSQAAHTLPLPVPDEAGRVRRSAA